MMGRFWHRECAAAAALAVFSAIATAAPGDGSSPGATWEPGRVDSASAAAALKDWKKKPDDPSSHARIRNLEGIIEWARGDAAKAARLFAESVDLAPDAATRAECAYNAALAASLAGDTTAYQHYADLLSRSVPADSELPGDLSLETGLSEAARAGAGAFQILETFLKRHPAHPRVADAEISLAELYLTQVPPQPVAAGEHIEDARQRPLTLAQREWLDHVAIWVGVASQDTPATVERARRFLDDWPQSERRPSVHMVLGESFFRSGDYPNAIIHFERLAVQNPDSDFAEPALFFAAKAASLTLSQENHQHAISLWDRVVEEGGALAAPSRHEQGLLELSREHFDEAIAAFDEVIGMKPADPLLRIAALSDRGEALYAKALFQGNDPALFEEAAAVFGTVETDPAANKAWRLQASVRKGKCLEALGQNEAALRLYQGIVRDAAPGGPSATVPVAEFDWYYRAGLAAIRLLQAGERWRESVAIADQVAETGGPRAAEAARIADRLRLRHFIWEDPGN